MSKTIIYDRQLENHVVVNEDGSINVKMEGLEIDQGDMNVNLDLEGVEIDVKTTEFVLTRSYNGVETTDYKLNEPHHFIAIANDSKESTITLLVNGLAIDILPWETFEAAFEPFKEFIVENEDKVNYRVTVFQRKGVKEEDEE